MMMALPRHQRDVVSWISKAVGATSQPSGLALLIAIGSKSAKKSNDVERDLSILKDTFSKLNFTVLALLEPPLEILAEVVKSVENLKQIGIAWPSSWKRFVVVYSGSDAMVGTQRYHKGGEVNERVVKVDEIREFLVESTNEELSSVARLFFFDYSRGLDYDKGSKIASRGGDILPSTEYDGWKMFSVDKSKIASRGGDLVPSRGNYLVSYSTQKDKMSSLAPEGGSFWIQILSDHLVNEKFIDHDIEGVLREVNVSLIKRMSHSYQYVQQPEYTSCLNEEIRLWKEAKQASDLRLQAHGNPQQPQLFGQPRQQHGMPPNIPAEQNPQPQFYLYHQQPYLESHHHHQQQQQYHPQHHPHQHHQQYQQQQHTQQYSSESPQLYIAQQNASSGGDDLEEVLGLLESNQQGQLPQHSEDPYYQDNGAQSHFQLAENNLLQGSQQNYSNEGLHQHCGTPSNLQGELDDFLQIVNDSLNVGQHNAFNHDIPVQDQLATLDITGDINFRGEKKDDVEKQDHGASKSTGSGKHSAVKGQMKTYKTILKEYCESKWKGKTEVQYTFIETSKGYQSTVLCPGVGYAKGDVMPTKKEAENSAAKMALKKLKLLTE